MQRSLTTLALLALVSLGCGGGGSGGGRDALVTQGAITRLGSVTAAGTTWDTTLAEIVVDGAVVLAPGMKVTIEGDPGGGDTPAAATRVEYDDDLQGRVESVTTVVSDLDGPLVKELAILDRTVVVTWGETLFDDPDLDCGFDTIDTMGACDFVEVSGFEGADGVIEASWIAKRSAPDAELKGEVSDLVVDDSFMLGGVLVQYDADAGGTAFTDADGMDFSGMGIPEDGLANGDFVEVRGVQVARLDVDATSGAIEVEQRAFGGDVRNFEIEGPMTDITADVDVVRLRVDGQPVTIGLGVVFDPTSLVPLVEGTFVEVEGRLQDGVLQADVVTQRRGEARVVAEIADAMDVDPDAGTLVLLVDVDVAVDGATRFDDCDGIEDLGGLADEMRDMPPVFVEVRGVDLRPGQDLVRADGIACVGAGPADLLGRVESAFPGIGTVTVLGAEIPVAGASFENFPVTVDDEGDFFAFLQTNPDVLLELRDTDGDATTFDAADAVRCVDEDACL